MRVLRWMDKHFEEVLMSVTLIGVVGLYGGPRFFPVCVKKPFVVDRRVYPVSIYLVYLQRHRLRHQKCFPHSRQHYRKLLAPSNPSVRLDSGYSYAEFLGVYDSRWSGCAGLLLLQWDHFPWYADAFLDFVFFPILRPDYGCNSNDPADYPPGDEARYH